ncbi:MAG: prolipoprotein diacylglyceryl transferase family protein [Streptosporangiaceae bacterium]
MPAAYLPSPASAIWHLGTLPVRTYAVCMVIGVVVGLWLTNRRYCEAGGRPGVILDMATVAVPVGLVGARLYSVLTNANRYFGAGRDWTDLLRVWDGGMGVAGAVAAGALAAWAYCRRTGTDLGPVALAAAPALAVAQAISVWGNWFSQELYGHPSGLPWAVAIAPQHRVNGYQAVATFQPLFLYESVLDLLIAAVVSYAIWRFLLSGASAFALYAALWATAGAVIEALRVDYSPRMFGLRSNMLGMVVVLAGAITYLAVSRRRHRRRLMVQPAESVSRQRMLRPRSSRATSGSIGLAGPAEALGPDETNPPGAVSGPQLQR